MNRDEECLRIAAKGLDGILERVHGASGANVEQHVADPLIQVAFMVSKVAQERCYMIPSFTEEIGSLETLTSGIRSTWVFNNLLGAAYLQMWWLMSSGGDVTRCEHCRRIMSLARPYPNVVASDGETRGSAATHAARRNIEAGAGHKSVISDRDLTVTQANACKHRETSDSGVFRLTKRFSDPWRTTKNTWLPTTNQKVAGLSPAELTCNPL